MKTNVIVTERGFRFNVRASSTLFQAEAKQIFIDFKKGDKSKEVPEGWEIIWSR